jgi:hypothetical protein
MLLALSLVGLLSIVPLSIWAATGRIDRAWEALRGYMLVIAILATPALLLVGVPLLIQLLS